MRKRNVYLPFVNLTNWKWIKLKLRIHIFGKLSNKTFPSFSRRNLILYCQIFPWSRHREWLKWFSIISANNQDSYNWNIEAKVAISVHSSWFNPFLYESIFLMSRYSLANKMNGSQLFTCSYSRPRAIISWLMTTVSS